MIRIFIAAILFIMALPAAGRSEPDPRQRLASDDPAVRSEACLVLAEEGETAVDLLIPLLRDRSMLVRHSAALALARIGGEKVRAVFKDNLDSSSYDLRRSAALGLALTGEEETFALISPLLDDDSWEVRWAAAFALGEIRDRRALALLGPLAESDPHYDANRGEHPVREAARRSMRKIEGSVGWRKDYGKAREASAGDGRPLFLYFRKTGSPAASRFEAAVFGEEMVVDTAQRFRAVWLDHGRSPEAFEKYRVGKVPAVLFLTPEGEVRGRIEGALGPRELREEMLKRLEGEKNVRRLTARRRDDPSDLEAAWQLAEIYMERGQWPRALPLLDAIVEADPYNVSSLVDNARFARGYIRGMMGDYRESYRLLDRLLRDFPEFGNRAQALYCLGLSALRIGRAEEGSDILRRLIEEYPSGEPAAAAGVILDQIERRMDSADSG